MRTILFIVFPYVAVILAAGAGFYRYWRNRSNDSSASSQSTENAKLFRGSAPWLYAIMMILLAHVFAWLFPGLTGSILGFGPRLFAFEVAGLGLALFAAVWIVILIARWRTGISRARAFPSPMDWILLFVLLVEVLTGAAVAWFDRWGSHWFLSTAAPWLWSLATLHPDAATVASLPPLIQVHFLLGFGAILLFPFTSMVHVFALPSSAPGRSASAPARRMPAKSQISSDEPKE
jgi:nitrate reductase gamma subunit